MDRVALARLALRDKYRRPLSALFWLTLIIAIFAAVVVVIAAIPLMLLVWALDGLGAAHRKAGGL